VRDGRKNDGAAWLPGFWLRAAHLAVLWGFAFVQPLFDLLGRNAEFFVARGNGRADILLFAFGFALVPPAVMLAVEWLAGRASRRAASLVHLILVALLVAAIVLGLINESKSIASGLQFAAAALVGVGVAAAYRGVEAVRSLLSFLTPAPAVFLALFLLGTQVSQFVLPDPDIEGQAVQGERDAPLVVVVFDELPAATLMTPDGKIDARRFPNFGRLADTSTWYEQATTAADHTTQAVPSILSGLEVDPDRQPTATSFPRSLFSLFAGSYDLNVWESATRICPPSLCENSASSEPVDSKLGDLISDTRLISEHLLLPRVITNDLAPINQGFFGFEGVIQTRKGRGSDELRLESLLDDLEETGTDPSLNFIHFDVPHVPWTRLPDGRNCQRDTFGSVHWTGEDGVWVEGETAVRDGLAAHLLQAGYADRLLGQLIDRLIKQGIWDDAGVIVVADHGGSFIPGVARRNVTEENAGAVLRIPFFVKAPGQKRPSVSQSHARTVDVLPTAADLVGAELPFDVAGVPADEAPDSPEVSTYGEFSGGAQTFQRSEMEATRATMTRLKERVLGGEKSLRSVFELGPVPKLLGVPTEDVSSEPNQGNGYELVAAEEYEGFDPQEDPPCQFLASLEDTEDGTPLAVSVNGRVAATTRAYTATDGSSQAFALIDPKRLRPSGNEVELWRIETGTKLVPVSDG